MSCWTGREQRRARAVQAELDRRLWEERGELDAAAVLEEMCPACGEREPSPACWLCGWSWLRQAQAAFEADQAAAAAAEQAQFEAIAAVSEAEARIADLTGWIERLQATVRAYEAGYGGRAVELTADLLARLEREAAGRASRRGRPSVTPYVGAVLAADADWCSGRRAMPGRARTAWLLDRSDRAIYGAWRQVAELGWATRTRIGGRNSLERREETGRWNDRAEFDLAPLHRSPVSVAQRAVFLPRALTLFGELIDRALTVLAREQDVLDGLRAVAGGWTDFPEQVRRAQLRAAVATTREQVTGALPALALSANICRSHPVLRGEYLSSCSLWGLRFSPPIMIHTADCGCGSRPGGRSRGGASRSSTTEAADDLGRSGRSGWNGWNGSPGVDRHRTLQRRTACSQPRPAPDWAEWAYPMARGLMRRWDWLARVPVPQVAAILGSKLGPNWGGATLPVRPHIDQQGADRLAKYVRDQHTRPVLTDPDNPRGYLAWLLDVTFAGDEEPPEQARRHVELRHQAVLEQAAATAAAHEQLRTGWNQTAATAATPASAARAAARAAALAAHGPAPRPYVPPVDDAARLAEAAAELAQHRGAGGQAEHDAAAWPAPAVPGGGVPYGRKTAQDR